VADVSTRILVIHRGRLRADGPPDELVANIVGRSLHVTALCSPAQLDEVARGTVGLVPTAAVPAGDGYATFYGAVDPGCDPAVELGARLVAAGIAVRELKLAVPSLEEYFQLMTEGADRDEELAAAAAADTVAATS